MHFGLAFRSFFRVLLDDRIAEEVAPLLAAPSKPPPSAEEEERRIAGEGLRILSALQRDGRLVDFLSEEIEGYGDEQIGAAVRDIHRDCRAALMKYVDLQPVKPGEEGSSVQIAAGFDPASVRLTGRVAGGPPFKGTLIHRGWRAGKVQIPAAPSTTDPLLIAPAEVEIP